MEIEYTPRYISKYWLIIIHNILLNLELKYFHEIRPTVIPIKGELSMKINNNNNPLAKKVRILLSYINEKVKIAGRGQMQGQEHGQEQGQGREKEQGQEQTKERNPPLISWDSFWISENFLFVPIKKNDRYNEMKWGYQSYFNEDISEWAIAIKINNGKFTNVGVLRFPKSKQFLDDNIDGMKYSGMLDQNSLTGQIMKKENENEKEKNHKITPIQFRKHRINGYQCWYSKERQKTHWVSNLDFDELHCINNGGVWDAPCIINKDCPFSDGQRNVCMPSGKCDMPYGIERIGYSYYNKKSIPNCVKCNNLDFDTCCDAGSKYKFKWGKK